MCYRGSILESLFSLLQRFLGLADPDKEYHLQEVWTLAAKAEAQGLHEQEPQKPVLFARTVYPTAAER